MFILTFSEGYFIEALKELKTRTKPRAALWKS